MDNDTATKFQALLTLERDLKIALVVAGFGETPAIRQRAADNVDCLNAGISTLIEGFTPNEMVMYGNYRLEAL